MDMLRFARQAARAATDVTVAQLEDDPDRQSLVLWPLTLLGVAAANVSDAYRAATPHIAWRRIVGLRNVLVHDYSGIDMVRRTSAPRPPTEVDQRPRGSPGRRQRRW